MKLRVLFPLLLVAGCLEVPSAPGQECSTSSDCDSGEVCDEGLCYGAPPEGMFAATLSAPSARQDLVSTEIADLVLPDDGWLGEIQLDAPVTISGRVEAYCPSTLNNCNNMSIAAEVRLSRPSRFPGGPALRFSAESKAGVPRGTDSFTIRVPRTMPGDVPWTVTIDPAGGGDVPPPHGGDEPAQLVPPRRLKLEATENLEHQTYTLGDPEPRIITGTLKDALSQPLVGYRIVALGRWDAESPVTEVSTVDFSDDGTYSITVAQEAIGPLEIVAKPWTMDVAPALHVSNVGTNSQQRNITQPTGLGQPVTIELPIQGLAGNGEVKQISGVRVIVTGTLDASFVGGSRAVFTAEATTAEDGVARISLLDGSALRGSYTLRAVPPASSSFGVIYNGTIDLQKPAPVRLPPRIALRGTLVDVDGKPLGAVSVTARRSLRFLWSVTGEDQTFLDEIPAATAITPESGEFIVWVDPSVADVWGHYDLHFETPASSQAPNWSIFDLDIPRMPGQLSKDLGEVAIPDAARIHARIVDTDGEPVEGSALRVYALASNELICREVGFEPEECVPASLVMGAGESDARGNVRVSLPRP